METCGFQIRKHRENEKASGERTKEGDGSDTRDGEKGWERGGGETARWVSSDGAYLPESDTEFNQEVRIESMLVPVRCRSLPCD